MRHLQRSDKSRRDEKQKFASTVRSSLRFSEHGKSVRSFDWGRRQIMPSLWRRVAVLFCPPVHVLSWFQRGVSQRSNKRPRASRGAGGARGFFCIVESHADSDPRFCQILPLSR